MNDKEKKIKTNPRAKARHQKRRYFKAKIRKIANLHMNPYLMKR